MLTIVVPGGEHVVAEVEHGSPWSDVLPAEYLDRPVLLGGFHGTWAAAGQLAGGRVSAIELRAAGLTLGAGVVVALGPGECPLRRTASIARYLAGQSARRCGPCLNGLPALADAVAGLVEGRPATDRVRQLFGLVERRGACAHPDGATRMVRSALAAFPDEIAQHAAGRCSSRVAVA
jgi:NADH:ubiquinone oxidoreductase subunit F (NADH-binding)